MASRTIETTVRIENDRKLIVQLPADVPVGTHHVIAVLNEATAESIAPESAVPWTFPVLAHAQWPADMPLTREEMYDDDGR